MPNFPTETWEKRETKVQRERGGEGNRGPRGEGYGKGSNGDNENKNVDPGKMKIKKKKKKMTIFNEETFSLKSGLQKGPRKLKIKNLQ